VAIPLAVQVVIHPPVRLRKKSRQILGPWP